MKKSNQEVVVEVSFSDYTAERINGNWPEKVEQDQVLMSMFLARGIHMSGKATMKPTPPVEIITDTANQKFVIKQIQ